MVVVHTSVVGAALKMRRCSALHSTQFEDPFLFFSRCMFGQSRFRPKSKEVNYRQEEKKILDMVLGPEVYDKRIRPSGINSTGE